jgi:hypothetical protein
LGYWDRKKEIKIMKEITRPAYEILEELEQRIDDALQPNSMGNHMKNAKRIKSTISDLEAWLGKTRREIFREYILTVGPGESG